MIRYFLLIFFTGTLVAAFPQVKYDTVPNQPEHYALRLAKFKSEKVVTGKILFAGNSITEGGNWRKLLKDSTVINRGISGDNSFGLLQRLDEIVRHKPSSIFLLIGINDLSKNIPNDRIIENIFFVVSKIHAASPKTKVFVQSLLPVNPSAPGFLKQFAMQESILEINAQLKKYSDILKFIFIDIHQQFLTKGDVLDMRYTKDGLHLNSAGYVHWVGYLKKSGYL
ncbi:SGNH/GDSL hydrolase family protein [soil metagenome]